MKKTFKIAALALLASFAFTLVGCSNSSGGGAPFVAVGGTGSGGGNETAGGQSGGGTESGGGQNGGKSQQNTTETKWTISGTEYTVKDGKVTVTQNGTKTEVGTVDSSGVVTITQGGQTITVRAQGAGSSNVTVTIATTTTTKTYSGDIASGTLANTEDANDTITIAKVETTSGGGNENGGGNANPSGPSFTVTFNTDGGSSVTSQSVASGGVATRPAAPTKTDCAFVCWFKDGALYDFASPVNGDIELTAKWYAFQTSVKELPSTTSGSYGTNATYVLFGDFPQTHKAVEVVVDQSQKITMGGLEYFPGSDGNLYAKREERAYWRYKYSDTTPVSAASGTDYSGSTAWFKVEPIKWRVYDESKKMLFAENSLVCTWFSSYDTNSNTRTVGGNTIYGDNYEYSNLRSYLNGISTEGNTYANEHYVDKGFYQSAFTSSAQNLIATTTVDNSVQKDGRSCNNTQDKIFVLSFSELKREHDFDVRDFELDGTIGTVTGRLRKHTDYSLADCQANACFHLPSEANMSHLNDAAKKDYLDNYKCFEQYGPCAGYWTRTPHTSGNNPPVMKSVTGYGDICSFVQVSFWKGVVPALCLK